MQLLELTLAFSFMFAWGYYLGRRDKPRETVESRALETAEGWMRVAETWEKAAMTYKQASYNWKNNYFQLVGQLMDKGLIEKDHDFPPDDN